MPEPPREGEPKNKFISRCTRHLVEKEGKNMDEALGQCYGMWDDSKKKKKK